MFNLPEVLSADEINACLGAASINDINLSRLCHSIARHKGFWDYVLAGDERALMLHVYQQLWHVAIEFQEFMEADTDSEVEELADALIVLADLSAAFGVELYLNLQTLVDLHDRGSDVGTTLAAAADSFRKTGTITEIGFLRIYGELVGWCSYFSSDQSVIAAIFAKCRKNMARSYRYGVKA